MIKAIRSFFYRGNDFQPPYFWITAFCGLIAITFIVKIIKNQITTAELISMLGFISGWIYFYNKNQKDQNGVKK